jgi:serine/threonine protein kinase
MGCQRHGATGRLEATCQACLLERALSSSLKAAEGQRAGDACWVDADTSTLTVQVPLGETAAGSVLLVQDARAGRLLRLKTWRRPATPGFFERFEHLRTELQAWGHPSVDAPLAAWVNGEGCPTVLSPFRQGVPLVDRVLAGTMTVADARALVAQVQEIVQAAHARGLAHGAIVSGNIICRRAREASLVDFGATWAAHGSNAPVADLAAGDLAQCEALDLVLSTPPVGGPAHLQGDL